MQKKKRRRRRSKTHDGKMKSRNRVKSSSSPPEFKKKTIIWSKILKFLNFLKAKKYRISIDLEPAVHNQKRSEGEERIHH